MIQITSRDFTITPSIRDSINCMETSLRHYVTDGQSIKVILSKSAPDLFHVQMVSQYLGEDLSCHHESHEFYKAVELCREHFVKIANRRKEKKSPQGGH
ncbi:MAG: HPF/RaiA family ribosome-associated protein [Pseudomonadota bacterium]